MERFKENLEARREQNIVGNVMMFSFLIIFIAVWGAFTLNSDISGKSSKSEPVSEVRG